LSNAFLSAHAYKKFKYRDLYAFYIQISHYTISKTSIFNLSMHIKHQPPVILYAYTYQARLPKQTSLHIKASILQIYMHRIKNQTNPC
jgi:hypothetical protein